MPEGFLWNEKCALNSTHAHTNRCMDIKAVGWITENDGISRVSWIKSYTTMCQYDFT